MRAKVLATALAFGLMQGAPAFAISGPAELPPPGYKGMQYIDSAGCVFVRAGYGGEVQWVQRIGPDRKPLCGYPPTIGAATEVATAAPAPKAAPAAAPEPAPAPKTPAPAVAAKAAPAAPVVAATTSAGPKPGQIGCFRSAPVPVRVALQGGGSAVVCTRGDGTMRGWRPPIYPAGAPVGASLSMPVVKGYEMTAAGRLVAQPLQAPKGYRMAWKDDRLNPLRGIGTAEGEAAQDANWTREVPAEPVAIAAAPAPKAARVTVSSASAPAPAQGIYVQIGAFGQPANAEGAAAKVQALGLPLARGEAARGGGVLMLVSAGPFATGAEASAALAALRAAGFADAYLR
jgi:cell division septation protein DedD